MAEKQGEFDWPRAAQLAALRNCRFPDMLAKDGSAVRSGVLKAVLSTIDQFAGQERECFASLETIAKCAGYSLRHTKRAIELLLAQSLLTCERRRNASGIVTNHYRIVWSELSLLADEGELSGRRACLRSDIADLCTRIFLATGYAGGDGEIFWQAGALHHLGLVSEHELWDACAATRAKASDKPGYFFACLQERLAQRGATLRDLLGQVRIQPNCPLIRRGRSGSATGVRRR